MKSTFLALTLASSVIFTGCASKKYVRQEMAPVVDKVNELDELTSQNSRNIRDVDARAQQGIQGVQAKATEADQKAQTARAKADEAQTLASQVGGRAEMLHRTVANLDNYRPVVEANVHFGFDQWQLSRKAKQALDELAAEVPNHPNYILEITGGADSVGDPQYNYMLSERRASAVVQYLVQEHSIPAHRIHLIGLGEDKKVASNNSADGRRKNRRVEVRLMTNRVEGNESASTGSGNPGSK